jgi:molybdopterin converting factor subunit 1
VSLATVQVFASFADLLGAQQVEIALPEAATVDDVLAAVRELPGGRNLPGQLRIAINRDFASPHQSVNPKDELALIPPVAGG